MRIVLIGPPGAGKGTQSALLAKKLQIPHLSTGEILRAECTQKTDVGLKAAEFMRQGKLVPNGVVQEILFRQLIQPECEAGYILDGFPRTVPQAEGFDNWLQQRGKTLSLVLEFRVTDEVLYERLASRGRVDDDDEIIRERMRQYHDLTRPLLDYYKGRGVLNVIRAGKGSADEVFARILQIIDNLPQATN